MSLFRVLPPGFVLPSLAEVAMTASGRVALFDPVGRPTFGDAAREMLTRQRAASVPCPAFVCGPPVCYVPPFPKDGPRFPPVNVPE